jgi:hypothetical protein
MSVRILERVRHLVRFFDQAFCGSVPLESFPSTSLMLVFVFVSLAMNPKGKPQASVRGAIARAACVAH